MFEPVDPKQGEINYHSTDIPDSFDSIPDFLTLSDANIPTEKHLRSQYLHKVMVATENLLNLDFVPPIKCIEKVHDNIKSFLKDNRDTIGKKHRSIAWWIVLRLQKALHSDEYDSDIIDRKYLKKVELLVSATDPSRYNLAVLWRALNVLINKLNKLRYRPQLEDYIYALLMRCAHFSWEQSDDLKVFNHVVFTRNLASEVYCINVTWLDDTEKIFHDIDKRILRYKKFPPPRVMQDFDPNTLARWSKWLDECFTSMYRGLLEKQFRAHIYEAHVCASEYDRFMEEDTDIGVPSAYSIIAKYRPDQISQLSKLLASHKVLEIIKEQHPENVGPDIVDVNYDLVCRMVIMLFFDRLAGSEEDVNEYVITNLSDTEPEAVIMMSHEFPRIVQFLHEFGVLYKGMSITYSDAGQCFLAWIKTACEDKELNGIFPKSKKSLVEMYDEIFIETRDLVTRPQKVDVLDMEMPDVYGDNNNDSLYFF